MGVFDRKSSPTVATIVMLLMTVAGLASAETSPNGLWSDVAEEGIGGGERLIVPLVYRALSLDWHALEALLATAPLESDPDALDAAVLLHLPLPGGGWGAFQVVESPIMEPGLAGNFPDIATFRGQGIDDPTASARLDRTPHGFHAMVLSPAGSWFIDPYRRHDNGTYISYRKSELVNPHAGAFVCELPGEEMGGAGGGAEGTPELSGDTIRSYRLAVAATGEYTSFHGGTVPDGMAAIVTAVNRVDGVYEREVAIRMVLVANNDLVVYTNGGTDPYTNNNGGAMLGQNQSNLDSVIGSANYDIGHVFSTGGGGIASLGVPCVNGWKAQGVTGLPTPTGDPFYIDYVAHEMGHQWGADHSFNGNAGSCGFGRWGPAAYEPGSGSTIMAYAGICGNQNLQLHSDDYFHGISFDQIVFYSTSGSGNSCAVQTATGNQPPAAEAGPAYTIPVDTPFALCGSGTDPDGDPLSYCWEEWDRGPAGHPDAPVGNAPIFRSLDPVTTPERVFPRLSNLVNNTHTIGELLPSYARALNFRLTARDDRAGGGGVGHDTVNLLVSDVGGPFQVTAPNTAETWAGGSTQTVTWDVANTDVAPISCSEVDIALSVDGGWSFPIGLGPNTPNDGSESVVVPEVQTSSARIRVSCAGNVFFDLSDANFTISASGELLLGDGFETCADPLAPWTDVVD